MCRENSLINLNCIHKYFCPQFPQIAIRAGIGLILFYLIVSWLHWWLFQRGGLQKIFKPKRKDFFIDLKIAYFWLPLDGSRDRTKNFWSLFLTNLLIHLLLFYVVWIVVISLFG